MAINDSTNKYTPNTIVVDAAAGNTPFTTIASAITAAVALGQPTVIYIRAGTYTENLTLVTNLIFEGANRNTVIIDGLHTVPAAGLTYFKNLTLKQTTGATNVFTEAGAGTCSVRLRDCNINITSGILFNLPLSTGEIIVEGVSDQSAQNSIIVNTTGKSPLTILKSSIGTGAVAALIAGTTSITSSNINCPMTYSDNAAATISQCNMTKIVTLAGTSTATITSSRFDTGAAAALDIGGTSSAELSNVVINSSAGNIVTGAGSCTYGEVTALNAFTHNVTTEDYTTRVITGSLQLDETVAGVLYGTSGVIGSTAALTNGQLLIGNTGNPPSVATLTGAGTVSVTNAAGAITITGAGGGATWTQINADGALVINQGSVNVKAGLLTMSLPAVSPINSIIELVGVGAGGWTITQAANQQILIGNTNTTLGVGGTLSSTDKGDCLSMICTTANLEWRVFGMVGNLTVV